MGQFLLYNYVLYVCTSPGINSDVESFPFPVCFAFVENLNKVFKGDTIVDKYLISITVSITNNNSYDSISSTQRRYTKT